MPFCARCLGASIGHLVCISLALSGHVASLWTSSALLALMLLDWGLQRFFGLMSTNPRRLVTGIAGGFAINSMLITGTVALWTWLT